MPLLSHNNGRCLYGEEIERLLAGGREGGCGRRGRVRVSVFAVHFIMSCEARCATQHSSQHAHANQTCMQQKFNNQQSERGNTERSQPRPCLLLPHVLPCLILFVHALLLSCPVTSFFMLCLMSKSAYVLQRVRGRKGAAASCQVSPSRRLVRRHANACPVEGVS